MRAVVQLVKTAYVKVNDEEIGKIDDGLLVFLGVERDDNPDDLRYMADKIADLRVFEDEQQKMNMSVRQKGGSVMVVSQFTICGDVRRGRRPSFTTAAEQDKANEYYEEFVRMLKGKDIPVSTGIFRAHMEVGLINDGPVTILLDSRKNF